MKTAAIIIAALALTSCDSGGEAGQKAPTQQGDPIGEQAQGCRRFFVGGKIPVVKDPKFSQKAKTLCRRTFAIYHSGVARQPIWVAETLTREQLKLAVGVSRIDNFHADDELPKDERAELKDYSKSGYDRGHMAPDADMPSREAADSAFALSNMAPQRPGLNRNSWADLEGAVRRQTRGGTVFVVTGPLFVGRTILTTKKDKRLLVPTHFFKAVYAENRGATVFVASNDDRPRWMTLTVNQFRDIYGMDPFPALDPVFRDINGVQNGSMNRIASAAQKNGATNNGPASGSHGGATCQANGNAVVKNPTNNNVMTEEQFRKAFQRNPTPEEYCAGARPGGVTSANATGSDRGGGQTGSQTGSADRPPESFCTQHGRGIVRNPTSGAPMTDQSFERAFGRRPGPGDICP